VAYRLKVEKFPVDFPFSGNFLETIPAQTASTAINEKGCPLGWPFSFMVVSGIRMRTPFEKLSLGESFDAAA